MVTIFRNSIYYQS